MAEVVRKAEKVDKKMLVDALQVVVDNIQPSELSDPSTYTIFQKGRIHGISETVMVTVPLFTDSEVLTNALNCAVETKIVYDFLRKLTCKEVIIGIANGNLKIKGGSAEAEFAIRTDLIFDEDLLKLDASMFTALPETFPNALNFTGFCCDREDTKYSRVAVYNGCMYGFSETRVAKFNMGDDAKKLFDRITFISPDCIGFVNKLNPKKYLIHDNWISLYTSGMTIYSTRTRADQNFDVDFCESILEPASDSCCFRLPSNFRDVLDMLNPFAGKTAKVKELSIAITNTGINVVAVREDGTRCKHSTEAVKTDCPVEFRVNFNLFSDFVDFAEKFRVESGKLTAEAPLWQAACPLN